MPLPKLLDFRRPKQLSVEDYLKKLTAKGLHSDGTPVLDPTPMAPPVGYKKTPSMVEIVRDMVRGERLRQEALESGHETFEDADDFDIDDEPEQLRSPYENQFDPPLTEMLKAGEIELRKKKALQDAGVPEKTAAKATEAAPPAKPGVRGPTDPE